MGAHHHGSTVCVCGRHGGGAAPARARPDPERARRDHRDRSRARSVDFVARKAGVLDFNLRALLGSFVGDVQIVADFEGYRAQILAEVDRVMGLSLRLMPNPDDVELYLVAHSEGTVIAFLSVLTALAHPDAHAWIRRVKGFMTIGSPVEVHHLLWPHLWRESASLVPSADLSALHIPWFNYMDWGDPIAYPLSETKKWLMDRQFAQHLDLTEVPFSRAYLPGKAHIDYWKDDDVFGHFLGTVVKPAGVPESRSPRLPRTKMWAVVASYAVPQLLILLVMLGATYLFYRPVMSVIGSKPTAATITRDVLGIGLLLLGITAAARLPRLTNQYRWWLLSAALLVLSMALYTTIACPAAQASLGTVFYKATWLPEAPFRQLASWTDSMLREKLGWECATQVTHDRNVTAGTLAVAAVLTLVCGIVASWRPAWIPRLLPSLGLLAAAVLVIVYLCSVVR